MNNEPPSANAPQPNIAFAIFLTTVAIIAAFFAFNLSGLFRPAPQTPATLPLILNSPPQTQMPDALQALDVINTGVVTPYDIQARTLTNGGMQYVASYDVPNLMAEYQRLKALPQVNKMFALQTDQMTGGNFTLSFFRTLQQLQIVGISKPGTSGGGTVVVSYYSRV